MFGRRVRGKIWDTELIRSGQHSGETVREEKNSLKRSWFKQVTLRTHILSMLYSFKHAGNVRRSKENVAREPMR